MEFLLRLFDTSDFPARWTCGRWSPGHGWLHILSDIGVWSAYFTIPVVLGYFLARRKDLPFRSVFLLFAAFIVLCGITHLMEAVIFWWPAYRLAGVLKLLTAVVSWLTVFALIRVAPTVLAMRTPDELEREIVARKQAEERLRDGNEQLERRVHERTLELAEQAERLRTTLASIGDAVISTDVEGRITNLNAVAATLTGWATADAVGQSLDTVFNIVNEETRRAVENPATRALAEGVIVGLANSTILIARDGRERPIDDSAAPIRCKDGEVVGCVLVFRDITERHRQEAELRDRERQFRTLAESIPQLAWMANPDGHIFWYNRRWYEYTGTTLEQMGGWGWQRVHDPDQLPKVLERWKASIDTGQPFDMVFPLKGGDEVFRPFLTRVEPVKDDHGRVVRWFGTNTDVTELERTKAALQENESRFSVALQNSRIVVYTTDADLRYTWIRNPHPAFQSADVLGRRDDELLPRDQAEPLIRIKRDVLSSGIGQRGEFAVEINGEQVVYDLTVEPLRDHTGCVGVTVAAMDITERKTAEVKLLAERERFRLATEAVNGIIYEYGFQTSHVQRTRGLYEVVGYRPDEVPPTAAWWHEQVHPDDREPARRQFEEAAASGNSVVTEYRVRHKDGHWLHVEDRAVLLRGDDGELVKLVGCTVDVTTRKDAENRLRASEGRLRLAMEAAATGMWTWDVATNAVTWSEETYAIHGLRDGEFDGTEAGFFRLVHPDDVGRVRATVQAAVEGRTRYESEFRIIRSDGAVRWVANLGRADYDGQGRFLSVIGTITDITERKRVETELKTADRRKNEFLATLAHELRNPLAPIRNGLQVMKLAGADAQAVERCRRMMERQIEQMVRLVDDLMDLSRITTGKVELKKQPVQLAAVVSSAVETSRPLIDQMGHELTVTLPTHSVVVDADLTRLAQVFMNLLNNAAKYSDRGGHIWLTVERQGSDVVVSVRDTGIGINADHLPRIFEMFTQVDRSLEKSQGGLGIGLTLVKRLVEMHGGRIEARSEGVGKGSEFVVRLPVVVEASVPPTADDKPDGDVKSTLRILIVDDNEDGADSLAMMLKIMGNDTHTAYDGQEGVERAEQYRPDVALFDIGLPKLNGYEACRRIREQPWGKNLVLIAVTGWGQDEDRRHSHDAGFDHHMVKPVDPQALMKLLAELNVVDQ